MVKTTVEYLENHKDLTSCPICGSEGKSSSDIIRHIENSGLANASNFAELLKRSKGFGDEAKKAEVKSE